MTIRLTRLGAVQLSALEIYIFDPCHVEDEFPGSLVGSTLLVTDSRRGRELLTEAANSADEDGDAELRDALTRITERVA